MGAPKDAIDETQVVVSDACCCFYEGFTCEACPIGCACSETLCCCSCEFCCKPMAEGEEKPMCICCGCRPESPSTCIKSEAQLFCCVGGCAFPPDAEVPCMIATCCIVCYPSFACCGKLGDINNPDAGKEADAGSCALSTQERSHWQKHNKYAHEQAWLNPGKAKLRRVTTDVVSLPGCLDFENQ